jgi:hypothetical protein
LLGGLYKAFSFESNRCDVATFVKGFIKFNLSKGIADAAGLQSRLAVNFPA